jgi:hypothetical protein
LTKELIMFLVPVLQSLEAPGECFHRLAATSAGSLEVARPSEDTNAPA